MMVMIVNKSIGRSDTARNLKWMNELLPPGSCHYMMNSRHLGQRVPQRVACNTSTVLLRKRREPAAASEPLSGMSNFELEPTAESAWALWQEVRRQRPLVQCITNFVSMDLMANTLLAAGCSPAMAHCADEVEAFVSISSALLINMGTLSGDWVASMKLAAKQAVALGTPWVLDPVGCGATEVRTRCCLELLACRPSLVRGNASEVLALAGAAGTESSKGVDSSADSSAALPAAKELAQRHGCIVAVSGATDYVTDGHQVVAVSNGVPLLTSVTATGCSVTALAAAFIAVALKAAAATAPATASAASSSCGGSGGGVAASKEAADQKAKAGAVLLASVHALAIFGLAAEESARLAPQSGPGSLRVGLLDQLYLMDHAAVLAGFRAQALPGVLPTA